MIVFLKEFFFKLILKKSVDDNKSMKNYPAHKELRSPLGVLTLLLLVYIPSKTGFLCEMNCTGLYLCKSVFGFFYIWADFTDMQTQCIKVFCDHNAMCTKSLL